MENTLKDLRYAARSALKAPEFSLVVILTLALGIGANTAIFSLVNAVLLRPLPYDSPEQLVVFWESDPTVPVPYFPISQGAFHEWRQRSGDVFEDMAGFRLRTHGNNRPMTLTGQSTPQRINGVMASANLFRLLGSEPVLGRGFAEGEDLPGANKVAVISHSLWVRQFGGNPDTVGRALHLDGEYFEIIGVLPPDFFFPPPMNYFGTVREDRGEIFVPLWIDPDQRVRRVVRTVARCKEGIPPQQAQQRLSPLGAEIAALFPHDELEDLKPVLLDLHDQAVSHSRTNLRILLGAVLLILLIACVNVANLLLVRDTGRLREISLRMAVGADRLQIVRQLLIESLFLSLLGGVAGVGLAALSTNLLKTLSARQIPQMGDVKIDLQVLGFALLAALATGIIFGLIPALQATRPSLIEGLKEGERGALGGRGQAFRKLLVVMEIASAVVLLAGAGLLLKSLWNVQQVDHGFRTENVLTVQTWLPESRYPERQVNPFFRRMKEAIGSLSEIEEVGAVSYLPFSTATSGGTFKIEGRDPTPGASGANQTVAYRTVGPGYFETMGIPLLKGRSNNDRDRADQPYVVVIDRHLQETFWPDSEAIGSRVDIQNDGIWREVVGVVENIVDTNVLHESALRGILYIPQDQFVRRSMAMVVRTASQADRRVPEIRRNLQRLDVDLPFEIQSMESRVFESESEVRSPAILLGLFASLAVALAVIGLYGVVSYAVGQRAQEFGVRRAMGAQSADILRMVGRQVVILVVVGIGLGLIGAWAVTQVAPAMLSGLLFRVESGDPTTYVTVALLFVAVALTSAYLPARRAIRAEPAASLRTE